MSNSLKLIALDQDDLKVISAHVQDAVIKTSEIAYQAAERQLIVPLHRFAWELPSSRRFLFKKHQRRLSVLHFSRVQSIKSKSIDRTNTDEVLSLLSVTFMADTSPDDPSGHVELVFSGGGALSLEVECLEVQLSDLDAAWETPNLPRHRT